MTKTAKFPPNYKPKYTLIVCAPKRARALVYLVYRLFAVPRHKYPICSAPEFL